MQHLHATPGQLAARAARSVPMSRRVRAAILIVCALLWVSGALWLVAHFLFPSHNEFGVLPNPWEATLMRLHGLLAIGAVFLCGWVGAAHISARWSAAAKRLSGLFLSGCAVALLITGYALYYTSGSWHEGAAVLHEWLGGLAIFAALAHWLRIRAAR